MNCYCGKPIQEVYDGHYEHLDGSAEHKPVPPPSRDETGRFTDVPFSANTGQHSPARKNLWRLLLALLKP